MLDQNMHRLVTFLAMFLMCAAVLYVLFGVGSNDRVEGVPDEGYAQETAGQVIEGSERRTHKY